MEIIVNNHVLKNRHLDIFKKTADYRTWHKSNKQKTTINLIYRYVGFIKVIPWLLPIKTMLKRKHFQQFLSFQCFGELGGVRKMGFKGIFMHF